MFLLYVAIGVGLGSVSGLLITQVVFNNGESPLKDVEETSNGDITNELEERQ